MYYKYSPYFHHKQFVTSCNWSMGKNIRHFFGPITTVRTTKMPKKVKSGKKGKNDIPYPNQFDYLDIIEEFHETERITETELDTLLCFSEYKPE